MLFPVLSFALLARFLSRWDGMCHSSSLFAGAFACQRLQIVHCVMVLVVVDHVGERCLITGLLGVGLMRHLNGLVVLRALRCG